ncbi:HlyD family efflux transporter periplasmic adaptor subunit [Vibrio sp. Isolate34]|uniref:HlyD family secretion protein n=1 Tax=Vibrio sp. Isolate34 TaxID=2908540 RepID=UPI001EFC3260|nr:HlyD family efflux transporter periplasmic adaptor subunit [Vibrio sp. Isolate34]MCG9640550.1 HlyD family efflux transporter periplasmic adaptor subunit [Vibrio sp. Isolate34]
MVSKSRVSHYCALILSFIAITGCSPDSSLQASGILERERVSLTATANEIIQELPVAEGERVAKGDVLVVFSNDKNQAQVKQMLSQRDKAQADLDKLLDGERIEDIDLAKANVVNARVKLADAEKNFERVSAMTNQKLAPISSKDTAQAERDSARSSLEAAQQSLKKMTQGSRQEDIDGARANLAAANAQLELQQVQLDELTVIATRDGVLDSLPYNQGERVPMNAVVAIIQSNQVPYARVYIPEPFRAKFSVGSLATVHIDGVENPVTGQVRWISVDPAFTPYTSMSEDDRSRFVYLAEIDLPESTKRYAAGIPVQVDME